jgi:L-fuconate dehydratase
MIRKFEIQDRRFNLEKGAGSDAIHRDPVYSYAVTSLIDNIGTTGTGFAFTLGEGNDLVCKAAAFYAQKLIGKEIEELMAGLNNGCQANAIVRNLFVLNLSYHRI